MYYSALLQSNTNIWGTVGFVFNEYGETLNGLRWLEDWEDREGVEPWMTWNYSLMLRDVNDFEKAVDVNRKSLLLEPDTVSNLHLIFVSMDDYQKGDMQSAWGNFLKIDPRLLNEWGLIYYRLLDMNLQSEQFYAAGDRDTIETIIDQMFTLGTQDYPASKDKVFKRYFDESINNLLEKSDSSWTKTTMKIRLFFPRFSLF